MSHLLRQFSMKHKGVFHGGVKKKQKNPPKSQPRRPTALSGGGGKFKLWLIQGFLIRAGSLSQVENNASALTKSDHRFLFLVILSTLLQRLHYFPLASGAYGLPCLMSHHFPWVIVFPVGNSLTHRKWPLSIGNQFKPIGNLAITPMPSWIFLPGHIVSVKIQQK